MNMALKKFFIENVGGKPNFDGLLVYVAAIAASMNVIAMGISSAFTSSASKSMLDASTGIEITEDDITWIASLVQLTAIPGAILAGYISQTLGRKAVLICNAVPFTASWLMITYAPSVSWIYAGRIIQGICTGIITVAGPTYLTEISTPSNRGRLGTLFALCFAIGLLIGMSLGTIITWRWLAMIGAMEMTLTMSILYFVPESPYWLIANDYIQDAIKALKFLRGKSENAEATCEAISVSLSEQQPTLHIKEFLKPGLYKPLVLGVALIFFQQCNGVNVLISYTEKIFKDAGGILDPSKATLLIAGIQVPVNLLSAVIIDKAGRRVFHAISGVFVSLGLVLIGIFMLLSSNNDSQFRSNFGWMPITGYIIFFFALSIGYAPLPFIMITEMTPLHARSAIVSIATICLYITAFSVTQTYVALQRLIGQYGVFFMYAGIAFSGVFFGLIFLPETRGKPLEEIQADFAKKGRKRIDNVMKSVDGFDREENCHP